MKLLEARECSMYIIYNNVDFDYFDQKIINNRSLNKSKAEFKNK